MLRIDHLPCERSRAGAGQSLVAQSAMARSASLDALTTMNNRKMQQVSARGQPRCSQGVGSCCRLTPVSHRRLQNHLAGLHGDAANAVVAAVGYNVARILAWLRLVLSLLLTALRALTSDRPISQAA